MSDGSLSQEEIDALLQGADDLGSAFEEQPIPQQRKQELSNSEKNEFISLEGEVAQSMAMTLSTITGKNVDISAPQIEIVDRNRYILQLSGKLVEIESDYIEGFTGKHSFIVPEDMAKQAASIMMSQEEGDLTDMAISAVSEAFSQMTAALYSTVEDKTGTRIKSSSIKAVVKDVPESIVTPENSFVKSRYNTSIEGKTSFFDEILDLNVVKSMANEILIKKGQRVQQPPTQAPQSSVLQPGNGVQSPAFNTGQNQSFQSQNIGIQPVQFTPLAPREHGGVTGNIGLLMDVSMQLTVELGRTKMLIKDILGMGEGTIVELDKLAGEPVDLLVNDKLIAKGEVVVIDENFGVRVTDIISPMERISNIE